MQNWVVVLMRGDEGRVGYCRVCVCVWEGRGGGEWKDFTNLTTQGYEYVHDMNQAVRHMRLQSVTK